MMSSSVKVVAIPDSLRSSKGMYHFPWTPERGPLAWYARVALQSVGGLWSNVNRWYDDRSRSQVACKPHTLSFSP